MSSENITPAFDGDQGGYRWVFEMVFEAGTTEAQAKEYVEILRPLTKQIALDTDVHGSGSVFSVREEDLYDG